MTTMQYRNTFWDLMYFQGYHALRFRALQAVFCLFIVFETWMNWRMVSGRPPETSLPVRVIMFLIVEFGAIILAMIVMVAWFLLICLSMLSKMNRTLLTDLTISISEDGITTENKFGRTELKWEGIPKIARTTRYLFLYTQRHGGYIIPKRAFDDEYEWESFCHELTGYKLSQDQE